MIVAKCITLFCPNGVILGGCRRFSSKDVITGMHLEQCCLHPRISTIHECCGCIYKQAMLVVMPLLYINSKPHLICYIQMSNVWPQMGGQTCKKHWQCIVYNWWHFLLEQIIVFVFQLPGFQNIMFTCKLYHLPSLTHGVWSIYRIQVSKNT